MAVTVAAIYCFNTGLQMCVSLSVCLCVCVHTVYGSAKGSVQPRVRAASAGEEMDEGAEPQTVIYIC